MDKYKPVTVVFTKIDISQLYKLHISLLVLLKSELNMTERIKIYISTINNVLIEVHPHINLPLELSDFSDMIIYVTSKMKIKDDKGTVLLSVIKNKINDYLPPNAYKLRLDVKGKKFVNEGDSVNYTLFINVEEDEEEDMESVRLSDYNMDSIGICGRIISIFEK